MDGGKKKMFLILLYFVSVKSFECYGIEKDHLNVCNQHGECNPDGNCTCESEYFGNVCEKWYCFGILNDDPKVCSGSGKCSNLHYCNCDVNWMFEIDSKCSPFFLKMLWVWVFLSTFFSLLALVCILYPLIKLCYTKCSKKCKTLYIKRKELSNIKLKEITVE